MANDATYGHDITRITPETKTRAVGTMVRLSLLRAPIFPDPYADQGQHTLNVSVRVGATIADAVREGYRRNLPLRPVADAEREIEPLFTVSDPAIVIEAVKLAEDGSGDVIVRAYESTGARVRGRITPTFAVSSIVETDLLERPIVRRWTDRRTTRLRSARAPTVPADHPEVWSLGLRRTVSAR